MEEDLERLRQGLPLNSADKYMALSFSRLTCGMDYLPADAVVVMAEPSACGERGKNWTWQLGQDTETLLEGGQLEGSLAEFCRPWEEVCDGLRDYPLAYLDSAASSQMPRQVIGAMVNFQSHSYANIHRGLYRLSWTGADGRLAETTFDLA